MINNITERFPNVPILPVYGNNDMLSNYQIPGNYTNPSQGKAETASFFATTRDIWFKDPALNKLVAPTFNQGGWYEYQVDEGFSILGLNTILFNHKLKPAI